MNKGIASIIGALLLCAGQAQAGPSRAEIDRALQTLREATAESARTSAQQATPARKIFDAARATDFLEKDGYRDIRQLKNGDILFSEGNTKYLLKRFANGDIQLYYGLAGVKLNPADMNAWNRENRLCRTYIDGEGDAVLVADLSGGIQPDEAQVSRFITTFLHDLVPHYRDFVRQRNSLATTPAHR